MAYNIMETIKLHDLLPILDGVSDAVFIDDGAGHCVWCNTACEELYQISSSGTRGKHVKDLEKMGIFAPSVTRRVLEENREITIIHENKNGKKLLTTGTPVYNSKQEISLIITVSRDITQLTSKQDPSDADAGTVLPLNDIDGIEAPGGDIISSSQSMHNVMTLTKRLASVNTTVLITGESGVGKGLIAKQLHEEGNRCEGPFVTVNCGAIPDNLIESELFGYAPGAFTGSRSDGKKGLFEVAQSGTIFLDEISELPLNMQVKLLRVIQEREITPVGGVKPIPIDVRIVSATNRDLQDLVRQDKFREDLYYRLNVVPITVPPLRDRPEDILPLIQSNLHKYNENLREHKVLSSEALTVLLKYPWPGNVRELEHRIVSAMSRVEPSSQVLGLEDLEELPASSAQPPLPLAEEGARPESPPPLRPLRQAVREYERGLIQRALEAAGGNVSRAAQLLEIPRQTLCRRIQEYGLRSGGRRSS